MERITPEMVVDAYKETGLVPLSGSWYDLDERVDKTTCWACGMTAVYGHRNLGLVGKARLPYLLSGLESQWEEEGPYQYLAQALELDARYVTGFAFGFDDRLPSNSPDEDHPDIDNVVGQQGWKDGRAAYGACYDVERNDDGTIIKLEPKF